VLDISGHPTFRFVSFDAPFPLLDEAILDATAVSDTGVQCLLACCPRLRRLSICACPAVHAPHIPSDTSLRVIDAVGVLFDVQWLDQFHSEFSHIELILTR
jgi:hypothetical protein